MTVVKRALCIMALAFGGGCAAEPVSPQSEQVVAQVEQALTLFDCQAELAQCTRQARGLIALAQCTSSFTICGARAANERIDETGILNECRADATDCLDGALTTSAVGACRGLFRTCAEDVFTSARTVLDTTLDAAEDAIQKTADAAATTITHVAGIGSDAFGVLHQCRDDATDCLTGVTSSADVGACRAIFDGCAKDAVNLAEDAIAPIPTAAGNLIACNAEFSTCVLTLNSPFDCAAEAQMCLGL